MFVIPNTNMSTVRVVFVVCLLLLQFDSDVTAQRLYGASVHWRPYDNTDAAIVLSYRLIWEMDSGICAAVVNNPVLFQRCLLGLYSSGYTTQISSGNIRKPFDKFRWTCVGGCANQVTVSNLSALYYTDIATFYEVAWETGVEMRTFYFDPSDDKSNMRLRFQYPNGTAVDGLGEAQLSMAIRNDTARPNISPLLNVFPVYRVPLGCSININLFPFDGDGDYVKCHWQTFPQEKQFGYGAVLFEDVCEMTVHADSTRYSVGDQIDASLYAQDYSSTPVKFSGVSSDISSGPFSRTPLKLLIHIGAPTQSCTSGPTFTKDGTLKPYFKRSYRLPFQNALLPFEVPDENDQMLTTGPRFMIFEERRNSTKIDEGVWHYINDTAMKGIHQACGLAYSADGVPGDSRCAVLMVEEPNECQNNPCTAAPGGICDNLFEYHTCTYPDDPIYNGHVWSATCQNETLYEKGNDHTAVEVALPVGLSILLLLIIVGVSCYLKRYWTEKFKSTKVDAENTVASLKNV